MKKLPWVILLLSSTVTFAAPAKKVFPVLDREPYVDQAVENSPLTPGVCETSIQAPVGYVIESVSFRAATLPSSLSPELGNYSGLEQEVFVQVTTGGVAGNFFFPTENKSYVWRPTPYFSPPPRSTAFSNAMSTRLYPDAGTDITLSVKVNDSFSTTHPEFDSCTLWVSGYLVDKKVKSGLSP